MRRIGIFGLLALGGALCAASPNKAATDRATHKPGESFSDCKDCPEMVVVPAGSFSMGSTKQERDSWGVPELFGNREEPRHTVTIAKPFAVGRAHVTRAQYAAFAKETHRPAGECAVYDKEKDNWGGHDGSTWEHPPFAQTDADPVVCMSGLDSTEYAAWLAKKTGKKYRLLSEAEYEYAVRGGTETANYWGNGVASVCENAQIMTTATEAALGMPKSEAGKMACLSDKSWTVPDTSFKPNPYGLYGMIGNAWEFIADCQHDNYQGAPTDGSAWVPAGGCDNKHLVRGGAFHSQFWLARSAVRGNALPPTAHPVASGFRVARDLD
jgi:formylglycine-generating enzyme required for sulfatase activity